MKNKKIQAKLMVCFLIITAFAMLKGLAGIAGLSIMSHSEHIMYQKYFMGAYHSSQLRNAIRQHQVDSLELKLNVGDDEKVNKILASMEEAELSFRNSYLAYRSVLEQYGVQDRELVLLQEIYDRMDGPLSTGFNSAKSSLAAATLQGETVEDNRFYTEMEATYEQVTQLINELVEHNRELSQATQERDSAMAMGIMISMVAHTVVLVGTAILLGRLLSKKIAAPMTDLSDAAGRLSIGDVDIDIETEGEDEIAELGRAFQGMVGSIRDQAACMEAIAGGDLTVSLPVRSDADVMNRSVNAMLDRLNDTMGDITASSQQVAFAAQQISFGAQNLAAGSGEQAASMEQFAASIDLINIQVKNIEADAEQALLDANDTGDTAQRCTDSMGKLQVAMEAIRQSSHDITKIIGAIDEIAYKTNILSLNAAVEAARAGQNGKGFAVVAEQVRDLSTRSAEAAKESANLIQDSLRQVEQGSALVLEAHDGILSVDRRARENIELIQRFVQAAKVQTGAVEQFHQGIHQVSEVIQSNSSTSQETAASAEEMSVQAETLKAIVDHFRINREDEPVFAASLPQRYGLIHRLPGGEDKY